MADRGREQDADGAARRLLVTEVTRMNHGRVCVAAVDLDARRVVRPLRPDGTHWPEALHLDGPLQPGVVVAVTPAAGAWAGRGYPHRTEDFRVGRFVDVAPALDEAEFHRTLTDLADPSVAAVLGDVAEGRYVLDGARCRSLGSIRVAPADLELSYRDGPRCGFRDSTGATYAGKVTAMSVRNDPHPVEAVGRLARRLGATRGPVVLRFGLAHPWAGPDGEFRPRRCYLQVHGLVFPPDGSGATR